MTTPTTSDTEQATTTEQAHEYVVTSCPAHGVKATTDYTSAAYFVFAARDDKDDDVTTRQHVQMHAVEGTDCWVCCPLMVIDPAGLFDGNEEGAW